MLVLLKDLDQAGIAFDGIVAIITGNELEVTRDAIQPAITKFVARGLFTSRIVNDKLRYYITKRGRQEAATIAA